MIFINKWTGIGRLTKDPELRHTQQGTAVCSFTLAVNRRFKRDEADFINIIAWQKTAEFVQQYFTKGLQVGVAGRIQTRTYDDKDGKRVYVTEIVAEEVYFADSKKGKEETKNNDDWLTTDDSDPYELPF